MGIDTITRDLCRQALLIDTERKPSKEIKVQDNHLSPTELCEASTKVQRCKMPKFERNDTKLDVSCCILSGRLSWIKYRIYPYSHIFVNLYWLSKRPF